MGIVISNFICMKKFLAWWWWSGWWGWCWWEYGWDGEARRPHAEARCRMTSNFHTMAKHHSDPTRLGIQKSFIKESKLENKDTILQICNNECQE